MLPDKNIQPSIEEVSEIEKYNAISGADDAQYATPVLNSASDPNFLKFSLDTSETTENIENELRGRVFNPETYEWEQKQKPKMNEIGINAVMFIIKTKFHKIAQLTAISDEDCKRITKETVLDINDAIYINWDRWGFIDNSGNPDVSEYSTVVHMVDHNIYFAVMRAKDGGERRALRQMYSHQERKIEGVRAKKSPLFGGLVPTGKRQ